MYAGKTSTAQLRPQSYIAKTLDVCKEADAHDARMAGIQMTRVLMLMMLALRRLMLMMFVWPRGHGELVLMMPVLSMSMPSMARATDAHDACALDAFYGLSS